MQLRALWRMMWPALCLAGLGMAEMPVFEERTVAGVKVRVPRQWSVSTRSPSENETAVMIQAKPGNADAPSLGLFAVKRADAGRMTPKAWSEQMLRLLLGTESKRQVTMLGETPKAGSIFQLYRLRDNRISANLSSFTSVDANTGLVLYLYFFAPEEEFSAMSGPVMPLVVFAGLPVGVLEKVQIPDADRARLSDLQSQIIEMNNRARQKIVYNMGGGWCYQGEPGCN